MTPLEALQGTTCHAARALGIAKEVGTLELGKAADFVLWKIDRPADLAYFIGGNPAQMKIVGGKFFKSV